MSDTFTKREVALLGEYIKEGYSLDNAIILLRGNPAAAVPAQGALEPFTAEDAWDELVHKDDRTSPEEYPEMALITSEELAGFMQRGSSLPSTGLPAPTPHDEVRAKMEWPSREIVAREVRLAMLDNPTEDSFNKRAEKREAIANQTADAILARFTAALPQQDRAGK